MKKILTILFLCTLQICVLAQQKQYQTKYVIVLVIDGPRYSETWGDSTHQYIPNMAQMAKQGVISDNFYNDKFTYTSSGHTAISTGFYQELDNTTGKELPRYPSFLQIYLKQTGLDSTKACLITSKDKLAILSNTRDPDWYNQYKPQQNCGVAGQGSGYRDDSFTFLHVINTLDKTKPHILFVNFREPDFSGHKKDWTGYLKGIKDTDFWVKRIFDYIQSDPFYKGKTALFVTNDHGRHLDGLKEGFCEHGDSCIGCQHINLFAYGPDFKKNYISSAYGNQTDLTSTIAELLHLKMPHGQGKVIKDLFK